MDLSYWASGDGDRHRRRSRWREVLIVGVDQEPVKKGRRGASSGPEFRRMMSEELARRTGWPRPKARVALGLRFTTSRRQPPNLEKLAKHYLDQLSQTHDTGEGGYLYRDDRQVQLLHVSAHHGWDPAGPRREPGIQVTARTVTSAVADMVDAAEHRDELDEQSGYWGSDRIDLMFDQLSDAEVLARSSTPEMQRVARMMRFDALRGAQEEILRSTDRWIRNLLWGASPTLLRGRSRSAAGRGDYRTQVEEMWADSDAFTRRLVLGGDPLSVRLPALPSVPGEGQQFKTDVRAAIEDYVARSRVLFPLLVPTRLTLFVVQPEQPKDLDNILLSVLPIIDDVMKPPQVPWLQAALHDDQATDPDDPQAERRRQGLQRLRSVVERGVWSCQAVELVRAPDDPPEGVLTASLGHGENIHSTWDEAAWALEGLHDAS